MNAKTDHELLRAYAENGSEEAFAGLVTRYIDLVYSAALRMVVDRHLAEDVTQRVFAVLAQNAADLRDCAVLSGWLHRTTRNQAAMTVRGEVRRQAREKEAAIMSQDPSESKPVWDELAPQLDDALGQLSDIERDALLLRFFESKSAREIGERLGLSEEAAQKRVARALERLRGVFVERGLVLPSAGLAGAISLQAVQAAPVGLVASVTAASVSAAATSTSALGIIKLMASTKIKLGLASLITAGAVTTIVLEHQTQAKLRSELAAVRAQSGAPASTADNQAEPTQSNEDELARLRGEHVELLRLRGEVGRLRQSAADLARLKAENERLRTTLASQKTEDPPQEQDDEELETFKTLGLARMNYAKGWGIAFMMFSQKNGGMMPETFEQAAKFYPEQWASVMSAFDPDKFEIAFRGSLKEIAQPARTIIAREKEPFPNLRQPGSARTYLFADGHTEIHSASDGNFEPWEKERLVAPPAP